MSVPAVKSAGAALGAPDDSVEDGRRRYFDNRLNVTVVNVFQGDFYVSTTPGEMLATVLGSCIAACVRDPIAKCGGMNHFLLPAGKQATDSDATGLALRYGSYSMEQLINGVLAAGGRRERLEIKVFGGANVVRGLSGVGHKNSAFIEEYLLNEGFDIAAKHIRGSWPRKVHFFPDTGQVRMRELKGKTAERVFDKETKLRARPKVPETAGTIELFD